MYKQQRYTGNYFKVPNAICTEPVKTDNSQKPPHVG